MRARRTLPLPLLLLAALRACAPASHADEPPSRAGHHPGHGAGHWNYTDKANWASSFPHCGGLMQSPINIDTAATRFSPQLTSLLLSGYDLPPGETLCLQNNGHTIVLELPESMTVTGGGFPQAYQAAQLHLHWGSEHSRAGSEHTVDGHRYAGEIHVVHYSSRFESIKEAQDEPGGLAVLAAFLEVGPEENKPYQHILNHLEDVQDKGKETSIAAFDVATLLPSSLDRYFRYNGSLTTPPCYQTVNWTVFNETIQLSQEQIEFLDDALEGDDDQPLQSNFRLTQGLHGRRVLASFEIPHPGEGATPAATADDGEVPGTPVPPGPGRGRGLPPGEGRRRPSSSDDGTAGGPETAMPEGAGRQGGSSLHTGDVLAVLFGALFGATALAFLLYVRKHRLKSRRTDAQVGTASMAYAAVATKESAA